jgi:hypothetical protein
MSAGVTGRARSCRHPTRLSLFHLCNRQRSVVDMCSRNTAPSRYLLFTRSWHYAAMEAMGQVLGPASTHFNDYLGTVAADDALVVMDRPSLYELAEVDRDRYTILAVT